MQIEIEHHAACKMSFKEKFWPLQRHLEGETHRQGERKTQVRRSHVTKHMEREESLRIG